MDGSSSDIMYPGICLERLARTTEDLNKVFDCDLWWCVGNKLVGRNGTSKASHVLFEYFSIALGCGILTDLLPSRKVAGSRPDEVDFF
jgi:hypothetical protein